MKKLFIVTICFFALVTLNGQIVQERLPGAEEISNRRTSFNLEEIKVRWKKAALENCTGVPCTITGPGTGGSFTCGTSTVTDIDGNTYNSVSIGTQCWTKENLKVTKYNDGTLIPLDASGTSTGSVSETWSGRTSGARTVYGHNSTNLALYGYLYNWYAASDSRKLCPNGWHLPTENEWQTLKTFLGTSPGSKMKSTDLTLWIDPGNSSNTNSSGFTALPAGYRAGTGFPGFFSELTDHSYWWSATIDNVTNLPVIYSNWDGSSLDVYKTNPKDDGNSVRCLKD
jgi:uncharacterized protein (TIGR02145 family)